MNKLKEHLDTYKKGKILDIATGQGTFMSIIHSIYEDFSEMVGIDTSDRAIEMVKKNFDDPRITAQKMNADNITFDDGYFDITCLSNSIHHMDDIEKVINEMARVTKDEGVMIFNEMRSDSENEKMMTHTYLHHFWAKVDMLNGITHKETMTKQEILDVFQNHPKTRIIDSWVLEHNEKQEITKEAYEWLNKTIESSLKRAEGKEEYKELKEEADQLKKRLRDIGFESAEQIMVLVKKA